MKLGRSAITVLSLLERTRNKRKTKGILVQGSLSENIYKCNIQVQLLFSTSETIATLVNYACECFIKLAPGIKQYSHQMVVLRQVQFVP